MSTESKIVFVDCQTTGSSPGSSSLLELGWNDRSWIVSQSKPVSNKALKLIGIDRSELDSGITAHKLWLTLDQQLNTDFPDFAVAHFARFELVYLDRLWREFSEQDFPIPLVCTHQITKRLFPNLPSYGLRALAGWFGKPLQNGKRAHDHVAATQVIWESLSQELDHRGLLSLEGIRDLCATKATRTSSRKEFLIPREKRLGLPNKPGIYKYLDRNGRVLYVGKATSLKQRVNSYFTGGCQGDHRKLEMLAQAFDLEVTPLETPLDAGLQEFDEIRRLNPPYNIAFTGESQNPIDALGMLTKIQIDFSDPSMLRLVRRHFYGLQDFAVLEEGFSLWRRRFGIVDEVMSTRRLLVLGYPLLKEWIAAEGLRLAQEAESKMKGEGIEVDQAGEAEEAEATSDTEEEFVWTAELIAEECSRILRRATRHHLRLRWWRRIAGATIEFKPLSHLSKLPKSSQSKSRLITGSETDFTEDDPRRIKVLLQELRRAKAKGGDWRVIKPWPMSIPFWI